MENEWLLNKAFLVLIHKALDVQCGSHIYRHCSRPLRVCDGPRDGAIVRSCPSKLASIKRRSREAGAASFRLRSSFDLRSH